MQCNVDVAVAEKQKQLHMRKAWWKKNLRGRVGFTNWGLRLFICGGDRAQGG